MPDRTVAIVGASQDRNKFGNQSVRAHQAAGYQVYPVNPKGGTIEGWTVYPSIDQVPADGLDRVSLYLPPERGIEQLPAIAQKAAENSGLIRVRPVRSSSVKPRN